MLADISKSSLVKIYGRDSSLTKEPPDTFLCLMMFSFSARSLSLSLLESQVYSMPSAMRPPTSAKTESMKGIPTIPNIKQNSRPPKVEAAKFP